MANEATVIELLGNAGDPVQYNCADATAITKGTLLYISSDPRTVLATSATSQYFAGIAAHDKVANDGATKIGVWTNGVFDLKDSGAGMTLGTICQVAGVNTVKTADDSGGATSVAEHVGQVLETAAASEVVAVKIRK